MPFASVGDIEIYHERISAGPRLLFISGTGGDLRIRPNVLDGPFPKHFDMLAYDQRGLGQTSKPDRPTAWPNMPRTPSARWPPSAGVRRWSSASPSAAWWRRNWRSIIPMSSRGWCWPAPRRAGSGASYPLHTLQQMDRDARARHMIPISDTRHDAAWATANEKTWEQMVAFAANDPYTDEPGHAMGQRRQLEARAAHDTWDRLGDIRCPVLISAGKYDGIALPETQRNMAARIKGAELRFDEGGHLFMLQDRAALPAMISFQG